MPTPTAADVLNAWERGLHRPPYERAFLLLALAVPEASANELSAWSIGRRDAHLLQLRESLFGTQLVSVADCPHCGARLEMNFTTADVRAPFAEQEHLAFRFRPSDEDAEYTGSLRAANTDDLRALALMPERAALIRRCLHELTRNGASVLDEPLAPHVLTALTREMEAADPQAAIELALVCVECGKAWTAAFDIVTFLWDEMQTLATRLLREVNLLAATYGWSEHDILALSPQRRQSYLALVLA